MRKSRKKEKKLKFDPYLIKRIQPQGGITFPDESYAKTGDGYECCLHVMEYPPDMDDFWMAPMTNQSDTIVTIDISTDDIDEVKGNLNRSMKEQDMRYRTTTDYIEEEDASEKFRQLQSMLREIRGMNEVVKNIDTRIFVSDRTWIGMEDKIKAIKTTLDNDGYKAFINLNEVSNDWCSMYRSYKRQQEEQNAVEGQPYTSNAVAGGYPFHFSCLEDPYGGLYGFTPTGGNFIFDLFRKTLNRLYYNAVIIGTMGSGKSTLLKLLEKDRGMRGDFVRAFDVSGEFAEITDDLGGKTLKPDGSCDDALNPLEILHADESEQLNYTRNIAKLTTWYKNINPNANTKEVNMFVSALDEVYKRFDLLPEKDGVENQITGRRPDEYPILSDVIAVIEEDMEKIISGSYNEVELAVAQRNLEIYDTVKKSIQSIIKTYGMIFNRKSTINNILDEQIVVFDISGLKEMETKVFDAMMGLLMALSWDNCVSNGKVMKEKYEKGEIGLEDVIHFVTLIDESHRYVNAKKMQVLDDVIIYQREGRKYFGGIVLASQSIRDYVPEGSTPEAIDKLKTIFELTQYKFIFHQDNNAVSLLQSIFDNVLTESQLREIPTLEMGECICCISSDRNLKVSIYLGDEEEDVFSGGA